MKRIYNEGRVVGLSSYDIYVRQLLSSDPEATPLSEREWLATSLAESSSMILRVPKGTGVGAHDFPLPDHSGLTSCTLLYASVFQGECTFNENDYWADSVTYYGELISNTPERHPSTPGLPEYVPTQEYAVPVTQRQAKRFENYLNITSGLLIQPGQWEDNSLDSELPAKKLNPAFGYPPFVRLMIARPMKEDVLIFLHGFVHGAAVASAVMSVPRQAEATKAADGDFLGPALYPWSCPIVFLMTTDIQRIIVDDHDYKLDMLIRRTDFLGKLHDVYYGDPLLTEQEENLLTEDGDNLEADKYGTVYDMWVDQGEVAYYVYQLLTQQNEDILTENGENLETISFSPINDYGD